MPSNFERFDQFNKYFQKSFFENNQDIELREEEFHLFLPFSDLNGWICSDDQVYKTCEVFQDQICRLRGINCLSFLAYIDQDLDPQIQDFHRLSHTRDNHTYVVAATGAEILTKNHVSEIEIKKYIIGAVLHDIATPALGDATKNIDNKNLHEELFWQEMLNDNGKKHLDSIPVEVNQIDAIIKNEGMLGEILDIADRITYVCQDLHNIGYVPDTENDIKNDISRFLFFNPKIGNIYKDVKISENQEVYFADPIKLHQFLYIRALLHQKVYMHPINQGRDFLVASQIQPFYENNNQPDILNPNRLRQMNDDDLLYYLADQKNLQRFDLEIYLDGWCPEHYEKFTSRELAQERLDLLNSSNIKTMGIKECKGFNSSTKYKVKDRNGNLVTYHDYNPQGAAVIEKIAEETKGFFVYY